MKKLLAFDLDGTLLNQQDKISPLTLEVLEKCRQAHWIVIATGRNLQFAKPVLDIVKPHAASLADGGCAYVGDMEIESITIPMDVSHALITQLQAALGDHDFIMNTAQGYLQSKPFPPGIKVKDDLLKATTIVDPQVFYAHVPYDFVLDAAQSHMGANIAKKFPNLQLMQYDGFSVLRPTHSDKWEGVKAIAKHLGVPHQDIIAFGDNDNDLKMLKGAGIGIAMGNATPQAKAAANNICGSNQEDGVAHWLLERALT